MARKKGGSCYKLKDLTYLPNKYSVWTMLGFVFKENSCKKTLLI